MTLDCVLPVGAGRRSTSLGSHGRPTGAIDASARRPFPRPYRPFIGPILKARSGSRLPVRVALGGRQLLAQSRRPWRNLSIGFSLASRLLRGWWLASPRPDLKRLSTGTPRSSASRATRALHRPALARLPCAPRPRRSFVSRSLLCVAPRSPADSPATRNLQARGLHLLIVHFMFTSESHPEAS